MTKEQFEKAFKKAIDGNIIVYDKNAPSGVFSNRLYWLVAQVGFGPKPKEFPKRIYLSYDVVLEKGLSPSMTDFVFTEKLMTEQESFQKLVADASNAHGKHNWALLEFENDIYGLAGV